MRAHNVLDVRQWLERDAQHAGQTTRVVKPRQLGCWTKTSVTENGAYVYGSTAGLHDFCQPSLPYDLNEGYPDSFIRKPEAESTPVEVIMRAALAVMPDGQLLQTAHICTFRNNLNKIFGTPLKLDDSWVVDACFYEETMYLDIVKNEGKEYPGADRFTYYGYKFEAICTGGVDGKVDATSEFASLLGLQIGPHRILMAAEIDCTGNLSSNNPVDGYLELKTFKLPQHAGQEARMYEDKYPRWWLQSFLAGVPTLVLGGRDGSGMLQKVDFLQVASLPSTAAATAQKMGRKQPFDAHQLLRFGSDCLSWMLQQCGSSRDRQMRFTYSKGCIHSSFVSGGDMLARIKGCLASR